MKKKKWNVTLRKQLPGYAFMLPGFLFMAVYMMYPLVRTLYLSFTEYNLAYTPVPEWLGLQNYTKLFQDQYFMTSLKNTAVFSAAFFPLVLILSLVIALLLDRGVRGSSFFRTCIFLPVIVPLSLTGIIFQWILNERYGLMNWFLTDVLGQATWAKNWLGDKTWAMVSIVVVSLWKNIGLLVIMFMAGLQAIPNDIIEASRIDGAGTMRRIWSVILPNLKESFVVCGIWAIIQSVKVFEQPFVMTSGGPGTATMTLYHYTWLNAFKYMDIGYASAVAYFMGIAILGLSLLNMYVNRSDEKKDASEARRAARRQAKTMKRFARLSENGEEAKV